MYCHLQYVRAGRCRCINCGRIVKTNLRCHQVQREFECDAGELAPAWKTCIHRGGVIRQGVGDLCGSREVAFDVYDCAEHGECVLRRMCRKQPEQSCSLCPDALSAGAAESSR